MLQTQQHKFVNWQCDFEYRGEDFTTAVTLGNPDVVVGSGISCCDDVGVAAPLGAIKDSASLTWTKILCSGILVSHYLQSVTPALALGGELVYHRRPGEEGTVTSFLGRYTGKSTLTSLNEH